MDLEHIFIVKKSEKSLWRNEMCKKDPCDIHSLSRWYEFLGLASSTVEPLAGWKKKVLRDGD